MNDNVKMIDDRTIPPRPTVYKHINTWRLSIPHEPDVARTSLALAPRSGVRVVVRVGSNVRS